MGRSTGVRKAGAKPGGARWVMKVYSPRRPGKGTNQPGVALSARAYGRGLSRFRDAEAAAYQWMQQGLLPVGCVPVFVCGDLPGAHWQGPPEEAEPNPFIVMTQVQGMTLRRLVGNRGEQSMHDVYRQHQGDLALWARLFRELAWLVACLHQAMERAENAPDKAGGWLHRDLSYSNVLVEILTDPVAPDAPARLHIGLVDFGQAAKIGAGTTYNSETETEPDDGEPVGMEPLGTRPFSAPWMQNDRESSGGPQADVVSLGLLMRFTLTQECPVLDLSRPLAPIRDALQARPCPPTCGDLALDQKLFDLIEACLACTPNEDGKTKNAVDLVQGLDAWLADAAALPRRRAEALAQEARDDRDQAQRQAHRSRRRARIVAVIVLFAVLCGGGAWGWDRAQTHRAALAVQAQAVARLNEAVTQEGAWLSPEMDGVRAQLAGLAADWQRATDAGDLPGARALGHEAQRLLNRARGEDPQAREARDARVGWEQTLGAYDQRVQGLLANEPPPEYRAVVDAGVGAYEQGQWGQARDFYGLAQQRGVEAMNRWETPEERNERMRISVQLVEGLEAQIRSLTTQRDEVEDRRRAQVDYNRRLNDELAEREVELVGVGDRLAQAESDLAQAQQAAADDAAAHQGAVDGLTAQRNAVLSDAWPELAALFDAQQAANITVAEAQQLWDAIPIEVQENNSEVYDALQDAVAAQMTAQGAYKAAVRDLIRNYALPFSSIETLFDGRSDALRGEVERGIADAAERDRALAELRRLEAERRAAIRAVGEGGAGLSGDAAEVGDTFENGVGMVLTYIPAGTFEMGSPAGEEGRDSDEGPQHRVTLSEPFLMGRTEVTQGQWRRVMGSSVRQQRDRKNPDSSMAGEGENHPMYYVSWEEAVAFCERLTASERAAGRLSEGWVYTLPTEAQWEYACRAETTTPFHTGRTISTSQANYDGGRTYGGGRKGEYREQTIAVGSFRANAWGLYDMHGNVWEWCLDWHDWATYTDRPRTDPTGPGQGESRVRRGGSWSSSPVNCCSASRGRSTPDYRFNYDGFRIVLVSLSPQDP